MATTARPFSLQLLLMCAALACGCTERLDSGETLPPAASEPPSVQRLSRIELRGSLPLAQIQSALDEALPRQQDIDERSGYACRSSTIRAFRFTAA